MNKDRCAGCDVCRKCQENDVLVRGYEWLAHEVGVESWEELKGKYIRVKLDKPFGRVIAIGNLLKDKWFSFKEYFEETRKEKDAK